MSLPPALQACSVLLRVVKSRTPLLQAAKVLYRLSKDNGNDALFKREGLLEPMLSTVHVMVLHSSSGGGTSMHEVSFRLGSLFGSLGTRLRVCG